MRDRLVYIANNPFPYHTPILNDLSKIIDLGVVYMSRRHPMGNFIDDFGEIPKYDYSVYWSRSVSFPKIDFRMQLSLGVSRKLTTLNPQFILFSSWNPLAIEPLIWKRVRKRFAVMWAESTSFSGLMRGRISNSLRRLYISQVDAFISNGSKATEYLLSLGVPASRVVTSRLPSPIGAFRDGICLETDRQEISTETRH